jgi:hypothetical protein
MGNMDLAIKEIAISPSGVVISPWKIGFDHGASEFDSEKLYRDLTIDTWDWTTNSLADKWEVDQKNGGFNHPIITVAPNTQDTRVEMAR